MTMIKISELTGDAQRVMIVCIGAAAGICKHVGFCLCRYNAEECDGCSEQVRCLDLFQKETESNFERARAEEAEEKLARQTADASELLRELKGDMCTGCHKKDLCLDHLMTKVYTFNEYRKDGSISQSAEQDEHIGFCAQIYVYDECHDCEARIKCLASYLTQDGENGTQAP